MEPAYLRAYQTSILQDRIEKALAILACCTLCPRLCRVNRLAGERGFCRTGRHALVSSYAPHFGEEDPLVGSGGSGTIFFTHCSLGCVFCQNYDISHGGAGIPVDASGLAAIMIHLQKQGVHNINLVTPSHVVAQILEALPQAIEDGLRLPLVYNSSGYDAVETVKLLDGIVDIYMPDVKFAASESASRYCNAPDYPERARTAIMEMHRQVGVLVLNEQGIAERGLLVRHLVMPEDVAGTHNLMQFLAEYVSPDTYVNIMNQYRPCGEAGKFPEICRAVTAAEYQRALEDAHRAGIRRLDRRQRRFFLNVP